VARGIHEGRGEVEGVRQQEGLMHRLTAGEFSKETLHSLFAVLDQHVSS